MQIDSLDYVMKHAPSLRDQWLTLQPFASVIGSLSAGPQPQSTHYNASEQQYLLLDFSTWRDGEIIILYQFRITANGVVLRTDDDEYLSSMPLLWAYLRSLPQTPYQFTKEALWL